MQLHLLKPAEGSTKKVKRIGRGEASGHGGTSTKGNKGAQSRTGFKNKLGHEGGQMPIQRRIPKRGFKNNNKITFKVFNLSQIEELMEKYELPEFNLDQLYINGLTSKTDKVKILGGGEIKTAVVFKVNAISETAQAAIVAAGGTVEILK
jgi:large subunit ribosomal protein L15